jgi:integrase
LGIAAVETLRCAIERAQDSKAVFPALRAGGRTAHYRGLPGAWRRIIGSALPGISPHGLRHSFASIADDLGLSEPTIAALLGHSGRSTTGRYVHKLDAALLAAADRVSSTVAALLDGEERGVIVPLPVSAVPQLSG